MLTEQLLELPDDPLKAFRNWFDLAVEKKCPEPTAMTLATVSKDGTPSARIVLFKGLAESAFFFVTNYESQKAKELLNDPRAALVFFWAPLNRQIRVIGRAEKASAKLSDDYFNSRARGSQIGAWASPQSQTIKSREELEVRVAEVEARFKDKTVTRPPNWGGFLLRPERIEFWEGRESRLHERVVFENKNGKWIKSRLAP
jgi:pyridoxamine 5'-phosphate oxidase